MMHLLHGIRVLNTRPKGQAQQVSKNITQAGGIAIECPTLEIQGVEDSWVHSLPDLGNVNHAIFTSTNAVVYCFTQLQRHKIYWPTKINVIAIGRGTAKILNHFNIKVNEMPVFPDSEHILKLTSLHYPKQQTVLLFKGNDGRKLIEEELTQRDANVFSIPVYRRIIPQIDEKFLTSLWQDDMVDIILITSEQSLHNLFKLFSKKAHSWLQSKHYLVISERIAKAASLYGISKLIISHPNRMINALFDFKD